MSEMVERVARVLTELAGYDPDEAVINLSNADGKGFRWEFRSTHARAAIDAMRMPTDAVMHALENEGWDAAIDEALK